jgi:hypothetical protein
MKANDWNPVLTSLHAVMDRADQLITRLETLLPAPPPATNWDAWAFRWRTETDHGRTSYWLEALTCPQTLQLDDLLALSRQRAIIERNTRQFLAGYHANNVLLWGARGTGKSSLIKALLPRYAPHGLRLIEVEKTQLFDLPLIVTALQHRSERFILFCDDLSFDASEPSYKTLKAALDGTLSASSQNLLIYATSNRRHLLPESHHDNQVAQMIDGELHPSESSEEKISLSERFGLWLAFHPFNQAQYLAIVHHWLQRLQQTDIDSSVVDQAALQWALERGSRSGRVAWQFACDWIGRQLDDEALMTS